MNLPLIPWPFLLLAGWLEQQKKLREMKERNDRPDLERELGRKEYLEDR